MIARTDPESALITMTNLTAEEYKKKYEEGYGKKQGEQYVTRADGSRVAIEPKPYATEKDFFPQLFPPRVLRGPPPLLAVQQLRGTADVGAFQMRTQPAAADAAAAADDKKPAGQEPGPLGPPTGIGQTGSDVHGQRWIVVTGLVPVEKQELAYIEAFKSTVNYDPNNDYPEYANYQVQRVEVASPGEAADPDWKDVDSFNFSKDLVKVTEKWAQMGTEVVANEYLNGAIVFPLGPLVGRVWGESVAHPQDIPIQKVTPLGPGTGSWNGPWNRGLAWDPDSGPAWGPGWALDRA